MFKKLTPQQLNLCIVKIMTVITFLTLIAFAILSTCHFTKAPWNVITYDIGIGLFVFGVSIRLWDDNDEKFLLPAGFITSLIMYSGISSFYFIATVKALDIVVNILTVLWLIVGYKCYYDKDRKT